MPNKLRNPWLILAVSLFVTVATLLIIIWPLAPLAKSLLAAFLLILIAGVFSYRIGLFLFIFFRPLIDFTATDSVLNIGGLSLNLPTVLGGLMVVFSILVLITNRSRLKEKKLTAVWLVFLLWALISLSFSFDLGLTIKEILKFASVFLAFLSAYVLIRDNAKLTSLIKVLIFSSFLPALVALYQFMTNTGLADAGRNRVLGTLTHPNMLAYYLLLPITLSIFIFLNIKKTRLEAYAYLAAAAFLIFILFFTYTRGAYIALLLIFLVIGVLKFRKFLLVSGIVLFLVYVLSFPLQNRVNSLSNAASDGSISWRLSMWSDGFSYFKAKPITGYGFGLADDIFAANSQYAVASPDPHNDYLRMAIDGGVIGLTLYIVLILVLLSSLIAEYRQEPRARLKMANLFILAFALAIYAMSFGDNLLNDTALQWNFWILIGGLLATQWTGRNKTDIAVE